MNFGKWLSGIYKEIFPFLVGAIFIIVLAGVIQFIQFFMSVETALAIEKSETNLIITVSIAFVVSFILTWLIANVMEGEKQHVETAIFILLGLAALCVIGLMSWGATVYLSGTPIWAQIIIFLLVLLLFK